MDMFVSKHFFKYRELKSFRNKTLLENNVLTNETLIIVDIQKSMFDYKNIGKYFNTNLLFNTIKEHAGNVKWLYLGEDLGYSDRFSEIDDYFAEYFLKYDEFDEYYKNDELYNKIDFHQKEYGYFRDVIDHPYLAPYDIINTIRYLWNKKSTTLEKDFFKDFSKTVDIKTNIFEKIISGDIRFYIDLDLMEYLDNCGTNVTLVGGGKNECLLEIEYMLIALNKNIKKIQKLIY